MSGALLRSVLVATLMVVALISTTAGPVAATSVTYPVSASGWQQALEGIGGELTGQGYMMMAGRGSVLGGTSVGNAGNRQDPTPTVRDHRQVCVKLPCKICVPGPCSHPVPEGGVTVTDTPGGRR
jgi:hypothetical protein